KRNRVEHVEAIHREAATETTAARQRLRMKRARERLGRRPSVTEVVFGSGAEEAREGFVVDVHFLVTFAPPFGARRILQIENFTDEQAVTLDLDQTKIAKRSRGARFL